MLPDERPDPHPSSQCAHRSDPAHPRQKFQSGQVFLWQCIQPAPVVERIVIYKCFYVIAFSRRLSVRWLPIKPSAPVTNTFFIALYVLSVSNCYSDFKFSFSSIRCISSNSPISRKESSLIGYIPTRRFSAKSLSARSVIWKTYPLESLFQCRI